MEALGHVEDVMVASDGAVGYQISGPLLNAVPVAKKKSSKLLRANGLNAITNGDVTKKEEWSDNAVFCLLEIYGEKYSSVRRGSLSSRDWDELALHVNRHCKDLQAAKTSDQCKYKIENMKRRYKIEKTKKCSNLNAKILWPYFARMDEILGGLNPKLLDQQLQQHQQQQPQQHQHQQQQQQQQQQQKQQQQQQQQVMMMGIPGGVDAGSLMHEGTSTMLESSRHNNNDGLCAAEESQAESESPSTVLLHKLKRPISVVDSDQEDPLFTGCRNQNQHHNSNMNQQQQNENRTQNGENRRPLNGVRCAVGMKQAKIIESGGDVGKEVANSIRGFAEAMLRIEEAKIELIRDLERQRAETELKRTEMLLTTQMEIVRLLTTTKAQQQHQHHNNNKRPPPTPPSSQLPP